MPKLLAAWITVFLLGATAMASADKSTSWSMKASVIEACSCPMLCPCYFSKKPAAHAGAEGQAQHFCRSNKAFHVHKGSFGKTPLDEVEFWMSWDVGDGFDDGTMKWAVLHFGPSVTKEQRDGILAILSHLYPYRWETPIAIGDDMEIHWDRTDDKAVARLDGGKAGEVVLSAAAVRRVKTGATVIENLRYWRAPRNSGFVLMPCEVEAYRLGPHAFEYKGTSGFTVTFDLSSKDGAASGGGH